MTQTHSVPTAGPPSLSLTEWIVLGLVDEKSRHGFAVASELKPQTSLGAVWTVHRPLVYRALEHLGALGLVEYAGTEPGTHGPQRTVVRTTRSGRLLVKNWLAQAIEHPRDVRSELMAKFILLARRGLPLAPLADLQLQRFEPYARGIAQAASKATGADRVVSLWRLESMRATCRLLRRVAAEELTS
jgi:DNA-binding PadR family transcriptional regulator